MSYSPLYKRNLFILSEFCLFCLICTININGANFFHTKELFFFLALLACSKYGSYKNLWPLFIMLSIYFISLISNFTSPYMNISQGLRYSLGLCYLILLVFSTPKYKTVIIQAYFISAMIVAMMTILIWTICNAFPLLKNSMLLYFTTLDTGEYAFLFMIRNRKILNWWIMGVYYCTAPCMIPALAYSYCSYLQTRQKKYLACSFILTGGLMLTMARANILAALAVNFFYFAVNLLKKKRLALFFFITSASTIFSLIVVFLFLSDKTEASLSVKRLHKLSYSKVFDSNVLKYFFPGWGAGSEFYSLGYKEWTYITELSLYETIRRYGMIQTILIFFSVWLSPLIRFCLSSRSLYNKIFWSGTFFAYLFVACTNPFLLGSIGFCALLFMTTILEFKI